VASLEEQATRPFAPVRDHVLLPQASEIETVDAVYRNRLTPDHIGEIIDLIPEEWLLNWPSGQSPKEIRSVYTQFLVTRIATSAIFVKEALHARNTLV
jgi:hypothetical protein